MTCAPRLPLAGLLVGLLILFAAWPGTTRADDTPSTRLRTLARSMDSRTRTTEDLVNLDARQLRARVATLRKALADEQAALDRSVTELSDLRARHKELEAKYAEAAGDMQAVEDAVRSGATQAKSLLAKSARTSLVPDRLAPLEQLTRSRSFPGLEAITSLGDLLLDEIRSGASIEIREGTFLGPDGTTRSGPLMRGGSLFLGAQDKNGRAYLLLPGSVPPTAVAATPSASRNAIESWAHDSGDSLPLDPSHGAALSLLQARRTVADWIQGGGLLLWPILTIGLLAALAVLYKGIRLFSARPCPNNFSRSLRDAHDAEGWPGVETLLRSMPQSPAARILLRADPHADSELRDKQLEEGFLFELRGLESKLGLIAVLAAVAPLLGLLGTVTGMIDSFQAVTVFGTANPRIMSSGISEALITTQAGLGVAIPAMLLHQFLKQRVQVLAGDMEQQCAAMQALFASETGPDCEETP